MKLMKRNQTAIYYCLYKGKEPLLDEDGNETSEYRVLYERPVKLMCSVSHATGYAQVNMFGKSLVKCWLILQIQQHKLQKIKSL